MVQQQLPSQVPIAPEEEGLTLLEHLVELRGRLAKAGLAVILGMIVGMVLVLGPPQLMNFIIVTFAGTDKPYPPVQAVTPTETFASYMTVALTIGVILAMPVILYQLIAFIWPALETDQERRFIYVAIPFVTLCFLAGIAFGWFVTVPAALQFLLAFGDPTVVQIQPSLSELISTVTTLLIVNGVVFEMPVLIYALAFLGLITAQRLAGYRRYAAVIIVIIAAIITPTGDPVNLALLALPMYLLFELGIIMARFVPSREPKTS
jgi:sec-independent protein translocase protein TatC